MHPGTRKPYAPAMVSLLHQRIIEKEGLDHIRFEDLRHTVAVHALESKTEAKTVSRLLGHTRPQVDSLLFAVLHWWVHLRRTRVPFLLFGKYSA